MGNNTQKLGAALASRMKKTAGAAVPVTVELGTINKNLSLSVDSLKTPIPKGGYMIDIAYSGDSYNTSDVSLPECGTHSHKLPSVFRPLKAGDRVLVVWSGFEPVVVSIIVKS
jgi:hypothetical protein